MKRIAKWIEQAAGKLPALSVNGNTWVVYLGIFLLFGAITLYIGTWTWKMFWQDSGDLAELKEIIVVLCGAPFIAALATLRMGIVDKDKDGIADIDEEEKK